MGAFCVAIFGGQELADQLSKQKETITMELWHKQLQTDLQKLLRNICTNKLERNIGVMHRDEGLTNDDLIKENYKGIRPAPGYPACPDHLEKETIWEVLEVEESNRSYG